MTSFLQQELRNRAKSQSVLMGSVASLFGYRDFESRLLIPSVLTMGKSLAFELIRLHCPLGMRNRLRQFVIHIRYLDGYRLWVDREKTALYSVARNVDP